MLFLIELLAILAVFLGYFGFYPSIFLLARFQKLPAAFLALSGTSVLLILALLKAPAADIFLPLFISSFPLSGLIIIYGAYRRLSPVRIFSYAHIPVLLFALFFIFNPSASDSMQLLMQNGFDKIMEMGLIPEQAGLQEDWRSISVIGARLFFGMWVLDFSVRMMMGAVILRRIQVYSRADLDIPPFHEISYPDWPVWVVVACLSGITVGLFFPEHMSRLYWASFSLIFCLSPFYMLRGISVVAAKIMEKTRGRRWPLYLKMGAVLLFFWLWPYLLLFITSIGFLDTWIKFRQYINLK